MFMEMVDRRVRGVAAYAAGVALALSAGCSSSSAPSSGDSGTPTDGSPQDGTAEGGDSGALSDAPGDATTHDEGTGDGPENAADAPAPVDCSNDDGGDGLPRDLACTGLYSDWATKTVAAENLPYTPGYLLWSDNANKARYVYLPPGTQIDTTDMDNWVFPVGTKIWKEFSLGPQRVETRHFVKAASGWLWTTYRWTADGESGATELDTGETNVNGTPYEIPAHGVCVQCHGGRPDMVLGLDVINLGASTAVGLSLSTLIASSQLTTNPPASLEIPEDATGRARASLGWLHSNCGITCHNANSGALASGTGLFLKVSGAQLIAGGGSTPTSALDPYVTAVGVTPNMAKFVTEGFERITPGHPELSLIPTLDMARNNPNIPQMPPIVTHIADTKDVDALIAWIRALPPGDSGVPDAGSPPPSEAGAPDAATDATDASDTADGADAEVGEAQAGDAAGE
jgi:hypothetical protein